MFTRVTQINFQQNRILARSLDFNDTEIMPAGRKSRLF